MTTLQEAIDDVAREVAYSSTGIPPLPATQMMFGAAVNLALKDTCKVISLDTSLTGVANTLAYTLPSGVFDVRRVGVTPVGGSETVNHWWHVVGGKLQFLSGKAPNAGDAITLYYVSIPAELDNLSDTLPDSANPELLRVCAVYHALWMIYQGNTNDEVVKARIPAAKQDYDKARILAHSRLIPRDDTYPVV